MLQAWISSPRGSLYFAAEATPYNLEHLRAHVRALHGAGGAGACLTLNLGGGQDGEALAEVADLAKTLTGEGIQVRFSAPVEAPLGSSMGGEDHDARARKRARGPIAARVRQRRVSARV
jgi:hypothetical protein